MSPHGSLAPALAALLALVVSGTMPDLMAQTPKPLPAKMPQHPDGMKGMKGMAMMGPHHVLAMAYRDNLVTFAHALQGQVTHAKTVDLQIAQPAVAEMKRSLDQIRQHHQAQADMPMAGDHTKMTAMKQDMEKHMAALSEHLTALEAEVNGTTPDPAKVTAHTAEIIKQCGGMSGMGSKAAPHKMP